MKFVRTAIVGLFICIIFFGCVIWAFSPFITRPFLNDILEEQGLSLSANSKIRINPFTSHLTVNELSWQGPQHTWFALEHLSIKYSLPKIVLAHLSITEFELSGVYAKVEQQQEALNALGFSFASKQAPANVDIDENVAEKSTTNIKVSLPRATLKDIHLDYVVNEQRQSVMIKQLQLNDIIFDGYRASGNIFVDLGINQDTQADLAALSTQALPYLSLQLNSNISWAAAFDKQVSVGIEQATLNVNELLFNDGEVSANLQTAALGLEQAKVTLDKVVSATTQLRFTLEQLDAYAKENQLAHISNVDIPSIAIEKAGDEINGSVAQVAITDASFMAYPTQSDTSLVSFAALELSELGITSDTVNTAVTLQAITVDELKSFINLDKDGNLAALQFLESGQSTEVTSNASVAQNTTPEIHFKLGEFSLGTAASIDINDQSIAPVFAKQYSIESLSLKDIDTATPNQALDYAIQLNDGDYFSYTMNGMAKVFTENLSLTINGKLKELAVQEVSPYLQSSLGFGVDSGQLDSDLQLKIVENELDGDVKFTLRGATFSSAKAKQQDEFDLVGQAAIPLNVALNMLKDGDGNIKLTIPVDGDVNDPSFGMQYLIGLVVKKAVMNQTKKHLVNTFVPYGQILSIAYSAGTYALKVRFEDLQFAPQQTEVASQQIEFANQFVALMNKKANLQVTICPIASVAELSSIPVDSKLSKEQTQQLIELATKRGNAFKRWVSDAGVASSRLLVCTPEIDFSKQGQPRIKLSV